MKPSHRKNIGQFWRKVPEEQGTKSSYIQTPDKKLFLELCQGETSPCAPSATLSLHGQKELGSPLGTRVENGRDISRSVPLRFLHFIGSFSYFRTNSESIRNTGWQIRKRVENGLPCIPIVFVFPVFDRDIPFSQIRNIPFFTAQTHIPWGLDGPAQINLG